MKFIEGKNRIQIPLFANSLDSVIEKSAVKTLEIATQNHKIMVTFEIRGQIELNA